MIRKRIELSERELVVAFSALDSTLEQFHGAVGQCDGTIDASDRDDAEDHEPISRDEIVALRDRFGDILSRVIQKRSRFFGP